MRCDVRKCFYNDGGFCEDPDYVSIDKDGECEQIWVRPDEDTPETTVQEESDA